MLNKHDLEQWDILGEIEYGYYYDDHYGIVEGDIEFLLSVIGSEPKNILEVCCGSGRIFIPLAKAGHNMTGFDAHYGMLSRLHQKAKGLTNVKYYYADALRHEFETGFDVVLVAFNRLLRKLRNDDFIS
jgi:ubiquinone/menaquinone biosynthesis C-methylase UbiE